MAISVSPSMEATNIQTIIAGRETTMRIGEIDAATVAGNREGTAMEVPVEQAVGVVGMELVEAADAMGTMSKEMITVTVILRSRPPRVIRRLLVPTTSLIILRDLAPNARPALCLCKTQTRVTMTFR